MAARPPRTLAAVVLAAGKGERLKSATPKVLHPICGRPALWHVLQLAAAAKPATIAVVVGHGAAEVRAAVRSWDITPAPIFVTQRDQLGTGHAVLAAKRAVGDADDVLILTGDFDPVTSQGVRAVVAAHRRSNAVATVASTVLDEPGGYGRVVRDGGRLVEVVEDADATPQIRRIDEVSLVLMAVRRAELFGALPRLDRRNRQREYYLNRILPLFVAEGLPVRVVPVDTGGAMGLNSRRGLAAVEAVVRRRINDEHLAKGVTLIDPAATYIDVGVRIGRDTLVYPNTYLQGETVIGRDCTIGPSSVVADARIGDGSAVWFSVVVGSRIGRDVEVGPFVRMRPGVEMGDRSRAGAFVDMKEARVGRGSKVPHLSYVGDAEIGEDVNVGAATVTVNYDGYDKHRTVIGDGARIGSDTMLVAPVTIGPGAVTGAGSVITKDVPAGALAV
ncbi:MAG TPA: bifunctional UDP-N-acetylglucosamine diphosphorylase/glucosamine-1-phosphate N-acetyltransferase GlmU, partial [Actinomycetota bacterium]|nr:bifunctional UDP-N-acetylglucosamine diphosphorylase/glucosamine-1-phosphate N-acetyltransferase GlmU [Actinomycetota bacterium]